MANFWGQGPRPSGAFACALAPPVPLSSRPREVGGEEVDAVAVEVSTGAVTMLGGAWVGVSGEDLGVAQGDAGVECVGDGGVAERVWADVRGIAAAFAMRTTIR